MLVEVVGQVPRIFPGVNLAPSRQINSCRYAMIEVHAACVV